MKFMGLLAGMVISASAFAYDSRFAIDPDQDLAALESSHEINLKLTRQDKKVFVDASAVYDVGAEKLYAVVGDFDNYVKYGVPDLKAVHVVERGPGDTLYQWQDLSAAGRESEQYCEVHLKPALTNTQARATEWQMVPRRANWPYDESSQFTTIEGSWYMEPLKDGKLYTRYFQSVTIGSSLPGWLIELIVKSTVVADTKKVIDVLVKTAQQR
jgi:hypothetical protein